MRGYDKFVSVEMGRTGDVRDIEGVLEYVGKHIFRI